MKLTIQDVEHIAHLARLDLTDAEKERYTTELSAILSYVENLQKLDTSAVEPTSHITETLSAPRADVPQPVSDEVRAKLVAAFPKTRAGLLAVPSVFIGYKE